VICGDPFPLYSESGIILLVIKKLRVRVSEIPELPIQCLSNLTRKSAVLRGFRGEQYPLRKNVPTQPPSDPWIEAWLSTGRFGTYLSAAQGSRSLALALYEWNARLRAAFLHDLGHLEVGLRNAYDRVLSAATVGEHSHWTEIPTMLKLFPAVLKNDSVQKRKVDANEIPRSQIQRARTDAARFGNTAPVPGKVIAEVMFGFWTYLTSTAHEKTIWVPYLHAAYPAKTDRRKIHQTLYELRDFRNRVAHHEPLLVGSEFERRKIISVASRLLPKDAFAHLTQNSEVLKILADRPS
jgi:hypothetical protein